MIEIIVSIITLILLLLCYILGIRSPETNSYVGRGSFRNARMEDLPQISALEHQNYGKDAWDYTEEEFAKEIATTNPNFADPDGGNVIKVYDDEGFGYIQYTIQPQTKLCEGGLYITTIGGNEKAMDELMNWALGQNKRIYTHAKKEYHNGKIFELLEKYGFHNIGPGDNSREYYGHKWAQDLSKMTEFEYHNRNEAQTN